MRRAAATVANDSLNGTLKYYRLGPQFEKELSGMVDTEFTSLYAKKEDIPIELNTEVLLNINSFLNDRRGFMTRSLSRGQKHIPLMKAIFRQKGLPENLVYLALIESGFRTDAVSSANAVGPWQFIASTGRVYGLAIDEWVDERRDPVKSTYAAADYLTTLHDMFNSWPLAIAAYNSGEGKIQRGLRRPGVDNYWDMSWESGFLANETKRYVPSYLAAAIIARDPGAYGLEVEWSPPDTWDEVVVTEPVELLTVAGLADTTLERIRELNPHLKKLKTPPNLPDFVLRIPSGTRTKFYQGYAKLPEIRRGGTFQVYSAKRGDTLESVAKRFETDIDLLMVFNNVTGNPRLAAGQEIIVPVGLSRPDAIVIASADPIPRTPVPAATPSPAVYQDIPGTPSPPARPVPPVVTRTATAKVPGTALHSLSHVVRSGDTLFDIARLYGVNVDKLKRDNNLSSNNLFIGQILNVSSNIPLQAQSRPSGRSGSSWVEVTPGAALFHTVRKGDTISTIAEEHKVTQAQLRELNNLSGNNIRVGQKLRVGTGPAPPKGASGGEYAVASGDTISTIAERFGMTSDELRRMNGLRGDSIRAGQVLKVKAAPATVGGYAVESGDSISVIAEKFGMTSDELRKLNNLTGDTIRVGQSLIVRKAPDPKAAQTSSQSAQSAENVYEVRPGDSVSTIAEKFGMKSDDLRKLNDLESDAIRAGQVLKVTPGPAETATSVRTAGATASSGDPALQEIYVVESGDSVSVIAELFGMRSDDLRKLNDLRDDKIKIGQKLKVRKAEASEAIRAASGAAEAATRTAVSAGPPEELYEVVSGDSVSVVAEKFGMRSDELRELNGIADDKIRIGQKLKVRRGSSSSGTASASRAGSSSGSSGSSGPSVSSGSLDPVPTAGTSRAAGPDGLYVVRSGDTVSEIAESFGMKTEDFKKLNGLKDNTVKVGQKLKVPGGRSGTAAAPRTSGSSSSSSASSSSGAVGADGSYTVQSGDTVSQVAERFGMRTEEFKALNGLKDNTIRVGQKLKVRRAAAPGSSSGSSTSSGAISSGQIPLNSSPGSSGSSGSSVPTGSSAPATTSGQIPLNTPPGQIPLY
jgi:membrane-bound lytic murein transglycosylase D